MIGGENGHVMFEAGTVISTAVMPAEEQEEHTDSNVETLAEINFTFSLKRKHTI